MPESIKSRYENIFTQKTHSRSSDCIKDTEQNPENHIIEVKLPFLGAFKSYDFIFLDQSIAAKFNLSSFSQ